MRKCQNPTCLKELPESEFHKTQEGYLRRVCKTCYNSGFRRAPASQSPDRQNNRLKAMKCRLLKKFGMTMEQYRAMELEQGGVCKICGKPPTGRYTVLSVDHDHVTNRVRGLLCMRCNAELGWFEEYRDRALAYLEGM